MRIISGKNILNRAMPERLRTLRHCIFTGRVVERNGICSAASYGSAALAAGILAPRGAVAQRLRGYKWRSEKSVKAIAPTGAALAFLCFDFFFRIVKGEQPLTTGCGTQHPLRALGGTRVLLAAVSAAGGGRSCCVAGWVESRGREGGVGTPLPASGPAERPCALAASNYFPRGAWQFFFSFCHQKRTFPRRQAVWLQLRQLVQILGIAGQTMR